MKLAAKFYPLATGCLILSIGISKYISYALDLNKEFN